MHVVNDVDDPSMIAISDVIILASTNTDIPTYYSQWLNDRLDDGRVHLPAYADPRITYTVSLADTDVRGFVFWSKNYGPFLRKIAPRITAPATIFFTMGDAAVLGAKVPKWNILMDQVDQLVERFGAQNVIWKLPPLFFDVDGQMLFVDETLRSADAIASHGVRSCLAELYSPNFHPTEIANRLSKVGLGKLADAMTESMWDQLRQLFDLLKNNSEIIALDVDHEIQPGFCIDDIENRVNAFDIGRMGMPCPTKCLYCDTNFTVNYTNNGEARSILEMDPCGHSRGLEDYFRSLGMMVKTCDQADQRHSPYSVELRCRTEVTINDTPKQLLINVLEGEVNTARAYVNQNR
jgi:Domain of unknown function (DUF1848)